MTRKKQPIPPFVDASSSPTIFTQIEMQRRFAAWQRSRHGPAWRFLAAELQVARNSRFYDGSFEPWLPAASEYLALKSQGPRGVARAESRFPLVAAAERLNADFSQTRRLKLMVLADLPPAEIERRQGGDGRVLEYWEKLFFDVREQRLASDWLTLQVVEPEVRRGNPELAGQMRLAIAAGAVGVAVLLDAEEQAPLEEAQRVLLRQAKLSLRLNLLAEMPFASPAQQMQWLRRQTQLLCEKQRLELALEKLRVRCQEGLRRHELALERLRQAERRAAEKAAAPLRRRAPRGGSKRLKNERQTTDRRARDRVRSGRGAARNSAPRAASASHGARS